MHNPAHPGEVLRELMGNTSVNALATRLDVDPTTLLSLLNGRFGISAPIALRLEAAFGRTAEMWMNIQSQFDRGQARQIV
jgi:addiction module HigA family antidote